MKRRKYRTIAAIIGAIFSIIQPAQTKADEQLESPFSLGYYYSWHAQSTRLEDKVEAGANFFFSNPRYEKSFFMPDEMSLSFGLIHPKFRTPDRPINYIDQLFHGENPIRALGKNAVIYPNIDFRKIIKQGPLANHAVLFTNFAFANIDLEGSVDFAETIPFKYSFRNRTYRLGIGGMIYLFPLDDQNSPWNLGLIARADGYYSRLDITANHGFLREELHSSGMGYGFGIGAQLEHKIKSQFLPKGSRVFIGAQYQWGELNSYARLNELSVTTGIIIPIGN